MLSHGRHHYVLVRLHCARKDSKARFAVLLCLGEVRGAQYRQQLRNEQRLLNEQEEQRRATGDDGRALLAKTLAQQEAQRGFPQGLRECRHLYDVGRSLVTDFDNKSSRDCFYNAIMSPSRARPDRRTGDLWLSSAEVGAGIGTMEMEHPKHGHDHATNAFFDKGHLTVGS